MRVFCFSFSFFFFSSRRRHTRLVSDWSSDVCSSDLSSPSVVTRVTTLGELAASIAHEVNQPLAAIGADANACLHWLATDRPDLDSVREALTAIVKDGERAGAVITRIRTLLARTSVAHEPCDITTAIRDVLPLVGPEIG